MYFHGNLGDAKLGCYLFVHQSGRDQGQNIPLPGGEGLEMGAQVRNDLLILTPGSIAFNRDRHCIQHLLLAEGFRQEIGSTGLHGFHRLRDVAVAGHKDDWNMNRCLFQQVLKVQTARLQPDVQDYAAT